MLSKIDDKFTLKLTSKKIAEMYFALKGKNMLEIVKRSCKKDFCIQIQKHCLSFNNKINFKINFNKIKNF